MQRRKRCLLKRLILIILALEFILKLSPASAATVNQNVIKISGKVLRVKKVPGFRRPNITWWAIDVKTDSQIIRVRIAPTLWYPDINIKKFDRIRLTGFRPPIWIIEGKKGLMACRIKDETTGAIYDFSFRGWCKNSGKLKGKYNIFRKNLIYKNQNGNVVFSHRLHVLREKLRCIQCHPKPFSRKFGTTKITMQDIWKEKYCGSCHNGKKAFDARSTKNCSKCHIKQTP